MKRDVHREAAAIEPTPAKGTVFYRSITGTDKLLAYGKYYVDVP